MFDISKDKTKQKKPTIKNQTKKQPTKETNKQEIKKPLLFLEVGNGFITFQENDYQKPNSVCLSNK